MVRTYIAISMMFGLSSFFRFSENRDDDVCVARNDRRTGGPGFPRAPTERSKSLDVSRQHSSLMPRGALKFKNTMSDELKTRSLTLINSNE